MEEENSFHSAIDRLLARLQPEEDRPPAPDVPIDDPRMPLFVRKGNTDLTPTGRMVIEYSSDDEREELIDRFKRMIGND